jgi:hypothetical protein
VRFYLQWKEQNPNKKPFEPKASWRGTALGTDPECLLDFGFVLSVHSHRGSGQGTCIPLTTIPHIHTMSILLAEGGNPPTFLKSKVNAFFSTLNLIGLYPKHSGVLEI